MTSRIGRRPINKRGGFTFVEILIVILIIGVVLGITLPRFQSTFDNLKARSCARNLHAMLKFAQERAILDQQFYRVAHLREQNRVRLEKKEKEKFEPVGGPRGRPLKLEPPLELQWDSRDTHVDFGPEGELEKAEIDVLFEGKRRFHITVGEPLGRITLEEER